MHGFANRLPVATAGRLLGATGQRAVPLPAKLTVLVHEDHSFYYRNETDEWEGFNHELIDRMQRHMAVPVEIKSFASSEALFQAFEAGQGDIVCPALAFERASPDPTVLTEMALQGFPTLRFKVSDEEDFAWVVRKDLSGVAALLDEWSQTTKSQLFVANLYQKYFAHLGLLNKFDLVMLKVRYKRDLPRFRRLFNEAGRRHEIDPLFLAAVSYQESHWDPEAVSYTGVRGLMMLTQDTADLIGVTDRTDPRQSVLGGTKYLVQMRKQIDDEVGRPDNNYYALAAYNVGLGHVQDAQELVKRGGEDDTLWSNLRDALPLLSKPAYYTTLKYRKSARPRAGALRGQHPQLLCAAVTARESDQTATRRRLRAFPQFHDHRVEAFRQLPELISPPEGQRRQILAACDPFHLVVEIVQRASDSMTVQNAQAHHQHEHHTRHAEVQRGQSRLLLAQEIEIRIVRREAHREGLLFHVPEEQDIAREEHRNRQQRDGRHEADEAPLKGGIDEICLSAIRLWHASRRLRRIDTGGADCSALLRLQGLRHQRAIADQDFSARRQDIGRATA